MFHMLIIYVTFDSAVTFYMWYFVVNVNQTWAENASMTDNDIQIGY